MTGSLLVFIQITVHKLSGLIRGVFAKTCGTFDLKGFFGGKKLAKCIVKMSGLILNVARLCVFNTSMFIHEIFRKLKLL